MQCSQNVDVNGPHHGPYQLMASFSLHCHRLVEWGIHTELVASMVGPFTSTFCEHWSGAWFQKSVKVGKVGRFLENKETDDTMNIFLMRLLKYSAKILF